MTRLVFDLIAAQPEGSSPVSGGGEYARRVFAALAERTRGGGSEGVAGTVSVEAVARSDRPLDPSVEDVAAVAGITIHRVASAGDVGGLLVSRGATRFFSALPLRYAREGGGSGGGGGGGGFIPPTCEFVYTIHGLRPLELPGDTDQLRYATRGADVLRHLIPRLTPRAYHRRRSEQFRALFSLAERQRVITVSRHTRGALLAAFPELSEHPVEMLYSPASPRLPDVASVEPSTPEGLSSGGYYLVITANRWGKNGARAVDALRALYRTGLVEVPTVLVGADTHGKTVPYIRRLRRSPEAAHFRLSGYLSRPKLEALYRHARALVFPTLNEGFGYPPLECMACGTPVITSGINSIPELVGDAALLCNPWSVSEIASRILQIEREPDTVARLRRAGPVRAGEVAVEQKRMLDRLVEILLAESAQGTR